MKLDILRWDEVDLSVEARLLEMITTPIDQSVEEDFEEVGGENNADEILQGPAMEVQIDAAEKLPDVDNDELAASAE